MSNKVFKLYSRIQKADQNEDGQLKIAGYASTNSVDRVGDVIPPEAWAKGGLENYKKNPILLFNHNYDRPIGRADELQVDEKGLKISATISKHAENIHGLIKDGALNTFSVGFLVNDLDYDDQVDGFIIKDAELLEVSVVSVPCNQDACFELSKSFENQEELNKFKKEFNLGQTETSVENSTETPNVSPESDSNSDGKLKMDEEQIKQMAEEAAKKMFAAEKAAQEAAEKAKKDEEERQEAIKVAAQAAVKSTEERLLEEFEKRFKEKEEDFEKTFNELKGEFETKSEEFKNMSESKRQFKDRSNTSGDVLKTFESEINDAFLLGRITSKGYETDFAKGLLEKVNAHSTVTVSSAAFETSVSTQLERDIENELILAPLFREIPMTSANMTIPIQPDAGYAEITANSAASGTQPNGNMDRRGAPYGAPYEGITLSEISLNTVKMIAKSYLGNETEEDAIIPILPIIRESMIRSHVRGVENMFLAGNDVDGVYTSGAKDGLIKLARSNGRMITAAGTNTPLTAATLFGMRKLMGKYGLRPDDVVYIVSQQAYFELIEDAEFQDADLVGNAATKLTGEIGRVYGSRIMMCDEFAAPAAGKFYALAVNRRNFVVPRLRGVTVESEYSVEHQRRVLVTSQRLGFNELIPNAMSVVGLRYATA